MSYKEVIDYIVDEFNENDLEYEVEAAADDGPYDYWITIEGDTSLADEIICSYVGDHYEWVKDKDGNRMYCKVDTQTIDDLEEDLDDWDGEGSASDEELECGDELHKFFQSLIDNSLEESFINNNYAIRHYQKHCMDNKKKVSRRSCVYYDFNTFNDYASYENTLNNKTQNASVRLTTFYDLGDVKKKFHTLFEGNKSLLIPVSCGLEKNGKPVIIGLNSFANEKTSNYKNNTINVLILTNKFISLTLYPVDANYLETKLNNIISKYHKDKTLNLQLNSSLEEEDKKKKPKVTNADVEADMKFFNDAMGMGNVSISESGESKAKKLFKHPKFSQKIRTFAILTFYNQDKKTQTKEVNKEQQKELKKILSNSDETERILKQKTPYYKVKGKYDNVEQSFIIYNVSLEEAKSLAKTGKQQSFIFGKNEDGVLTFEFWANASKNDYNYVKVDERDNFNILDDEAENYYSQISKDFKFSIPFEQFEVSQDELVEKYVNSGLTEDEINFYIEESMNDTYNNKYRTNCRTRLVNSKLNQNKEDDSTSSMNWANDFNIF